MKKIYSLLILMLLALTAHADDSGSCGENATWHFSEETGTLTISGTGAMNDYNEETTPWFNHKDNIENIFIQEGVTSIGSYSFFQCNNLINVHLPNSLLSIQHDAFRWCKKLTNIVIPEGVTEIENSVFDGCTNIITIELPNTILSIGRECFINCKSLLSFNIPEGVRTIENGLFSGCKGLMEIKLPESVSVIKSGAFSGCSELKTLDIPSSVTIIGDNAFSGCTNLNSVNIPTGITEIEYCTFKDCEKLTKISIPNSVESIGNGAFECCRNLTSLTIPESVKSIGALAFAFCYELSLLSIPNSITSIEEQTFQNCYKLTGINLPEELKIIKASAFAGCSQLRNITIPSKVEIIYSQAFNISDLKLVNIQSLIPPVIYDNTFFDKDIPIRVPKGSVDAYKAALVWKDFTNLSDKDKYTLTYMVDGEVYKSFELSYGDAITLPDNPQKEGYYFNGWQIGNNNFKYSTMPAKDLTVTAQFQKGTYYITFYSNGMYVYGEKLEYGATITPPSDIPTKTGYTFTGWIDLPETMPGHDLEIQAGFKVNQYKLTYMVDDEEYKSAMVDFDSPITLEEAPTKEGYEFSGWTNTISRMPAEDWVIKGSFTKVDLPLVVKVVDLILTSTYTYDDINKYDRNHDGQLNIGDVILIVREVLANTGGSSGSRMMTRSAGMADFSQFTAARFLVKVPVGEQLRTIRLAGSNAQTHQMLYEQRDAETYAVVVFSPSNALLSTDQGSIVNVETTGSRNAALENIVAATPLGELVQMGDRPVLTGISTVDADTNDDETTVYDLQGRRHETKESLKRGVYIKNGRKVVVR